MRNKIKAMKQHLQKTKGQGLPEYALIIGFIALVVVVSLGMIPQPIVNILATVTEALGIN